jgi:hypothetical protein
VGTLGTLEKRERRIHVCAASRLKHEVVDVQTETLVVTTSHQRPPRHHEIQTRPHRNSLTTSDRPISKTQHGASGRTREIAKKLVTYCSLVMSLIMFVVCMVRVVMDCYRTVLIK